MTKIRIIIIACLASKLLIRKTLTVSINCYSRLSLIKTEIDTLYQANKSPKK